MELVEKHKPRAAEPLTKEEKDEIRQLFQNAFESQMNDGCITAEGVSEKIIKFLLEVRTPLITGQHGKKLGNKRICMRLGTGKNMRLMFPALKKQSSSGWAFPDDPDEQTIALSSVKFPHSNPARINVSGKTHIIN